ncbi:hypothetical protein Q8A73_000371 [Channa argus]|nr:hypothetical protein Q8A73_000371 [Channa argus]
MAGDYPKLAPGFGSPARNRTRVCSPRPDRTCRAPGRRLTGSPGASCATKTPTIQLGMEIIGWQCDWYLPEHTNTHTHTESADDLGVPAAADMPRTMETHTAITLPAEHTVPITV